MMQLPQGLASLPQELTSLPNELIIVIFNFIEKITDKRQFLKTCKLYNNLTKELFKNYLDNYFSINECIWNNKSYCIENFTLELCNDSYFNMIPTRYFNKRNSNLIPLLIKYGQLELLKFAIRNGCVLHNDTCNVAAHYGQLDVLKWTIANGCTMSEITCVKAAQYGHLEVLKWLRENGCNWNKFTCALAAANGHLEVLKWSRENGCEWDSLTLDYATINQQTDVFNWALENGCSG